MTATVRYRRGEDFVRRTRHHAIEGEAALELPFGFADPEPPQPGSIAVILHAFHLDLLDEVRLYLGNVPFRADLFVSTDTQHKRRRITDLFGDWPSGIVEVAVMPNRGRDVAPKLVGFDGVHRRYDYVLHLHTKQSSHETRLVGWRGYILETLLGSPRTVQDVFSLFRQMPRLGLVAPQHVDELRPWIRWGANFDDAAKLAAAMGVALPRWTPIDFPSGSMFWARSAALRPLLDLRLGFDDFPPETGQTDGTVAHAIERLYFLIAERAGFDWLKVAARGELHDDADIVRVSSLEELRRFIRRAPIRLTERLRESTPEEVGRAIELPPAKPRRVLHARWRRSLGDDRPIAAAVQVLVALLGPAARSDASAADADRLIGRLPTGATGTVRRITGEKRSDVVRSAVSAGADLVVLIDRPGFLTPGALEAFLRMSAAHGGRAVMEAAVVPDPSGKPVDPDDFTVPVIDGPVVAITRAAAEAGADGAAGEPGAVVARLRCPRASFHPAPANAAYADSAEPIDVAMRLEDMADVPLARLSLFTLLGQPSGHGGDPRGPAPPIHVRLLTERLDLAELGRIRDALSEDRSGGGGVALSIENWDYRLPLGLRIPLLNRALQRGAGRYFCVLEAGDLLLPGALATLLDRLRLSEAALALAGRFEQTSRWWGDVVLPLRPAARPARPDRSPFFMLDRRRMEQPPVFQVDEDGDEIADFIERVGIGHRVDDALLSTPLALRPVFGSLTSERP